MTTIATVIIAFTTLATLGTTAPPAAAVAAPAARADLTLAEQAGRAFDGKRFAEAAALYRAWAERDRGDGHPLVMAGVARFHLDDESGARRDLRRALRRPLGAEDRELAQLYLGLLPDEAEPSAWELAVTTTGAGGYDGNPRLLAPGDLEAATGASDGDGALFASLDLELGLRREHDAFALELTYELGQLAYLDRTLGDLDFQEHGLELRLDARLTRLLSTSLTARGELSFIGVGATLQPFQRAARVDPELVLGTRAARVRVAAAAELTETLDEELRFLSGHRLELRVAPEAELVGWRLSLGVRGRLDRLGAAASEPETDDALAESCPSCTTTRIEPHSNRAIALNARLSAPFTWRLRPSLHARWERRSYDEPAHDMIAGAGAAARVDVHVRRDQRVGAGARLALRITDATTLVLRYDVSRLVSWYEEAGTGAASLGRHYDRHSVGFELNIDWL